MRAFLKLLPACLAIAAVAVPVTPAFSSGGGSDLRPIVTAPTPSSKDITATSARLTAIVQPMVLASVHVEIGTTADYGFKTAEKLIPYTVPVQVWSTVTGFAPATTYHFRYVTTNAFGSTEGPDRTFTTLAAPADVPPPPPVPPTEVAPPAATTPPAPQEPDPLNVPDITPPLPAAGTLAEPRAPGASDDDDELAGASPVLVPEKSKTLIADGVSGNVSVRVPGSDSFKDASAAAAIPVGSTVDARHGTIELHAETGAGIDTGRFWGAIFEVRQPTSAKGTTELRLVSGRPARCGAKARAAGGAAHAARRRNVRGLWGKDDHGRFRTRGRNSVATVRGTEWYVAERCAGTLTRVIKGAVEVRDTNSGRTVLVRAGQHLMVRDPARRSRK